MEYLILYLAAEFSTSLYSCLVFPSLGVYILIGAGALMMLVGFLGCCGALQESQCMLGMVSVQSTVKIFNSTMRKEGKCCYAVKGQQALIVLAPRGHLHNANVLNIVSISGPKSKCPCCI